MEYVDGTSLQDIVNKHTGRLPVERACHYACQAAVGLQHIHEAGLIHRDIKPGNLLLNRQGLIKILDLGLARFFDDARSGLTQKFNKNAVLGSADYLCPEQATSLGVDIRADIYSLGASLYFLLAGEPPFGKGGSVTQKLMWHQLKEPTPLHEHRPDLPPELVAVVQKMMAKNPDQRYQVPKDVLEALAPWTPAAVPPPDEREMPKLCPAARVQLTESGTLPQVFAFGNRYGRPGDRGLGKPSAGSNSSSSTVKMRSASSSKTAPYAQVPAPPVAPSQTATRPEPPPTSPRAWLLTAVLAVVLGIAGGIVAYRFTAGASTPPPPQEQQQR